MCRRHAYIWTPRSLSHTSTHPNKVTESHGHVMNDLFTTLLFHVNWPSHSWDKAISNADLENSRSRSWVWSKGRVSPVSSTDFASFSFHINQTKTSWDTAIPKFDLEKSKVKVISEVKGQGHVVDSVSNQCTSISFLSCQSDQRFLRYGQWSVWHSTNT